MQVWVALTTSNAIPENLSPILADKTPTQSTPARKSRGCPRSEIALRTEDAPKALKAQINTQPFETLTASIGGWLSALLFWICDAYERLPPWVQHAPPMRAALRWAKAKVTADLRRVAHAVRVLLVAQAYARMKHTARAPRPRHPHTAARGFRRAHRRSHLIRRFTGGALSGLHHGSLRQRAERLCAILANLPTLIARTLVRMRAIWRNRGETALILAAARDACVSIADRATPACADTS